MKDPGGCGYPVAGSPIDYPEGTKGKAGPVAVVVIQPARNFSGEYTAPTRAAVSLDKNSREFKQFDRCRRSRTTRAEACASDGGEPGDGQLVDGWTWWKTPAFTG